MEDRKMIYILNFPLLFPPLTTIQKFSTDLNHLIGSIDKKEKIGRVYNLLTIIIRKFRKIRKITERFIPIYIRCIISSHALRQIDNNW